jgi:hypothetical protein
MSHDSSATTSAVVGSSQVSFRGKRGMGRVAPAERESSGEEQNGAERSDEESVERRGKDRRVETR